MECRGGEEIFDIWQCPIIYLAPPGGCNKILEVCPEPLLGCLLPGCIRKGANFQNPRPPTRILLPPGVSSKSVVFYMYLASIGDAL